MTLLHDQIRARVDAAIGRRRRGEPEPTTDIEPTGVEFRELPATAVLLRAACVECTSCYSLVLRGSEIEHARRHVQEGLRAAGLLADSPPFIVAEVPAPPPPS